MPNYLLAYHGGSMAETEEARAAVMAAWGAWFQDVGAAMVDPGNPVGPARTVTGSGAAEGGGANPVTGYSIIKSDTLDDAVGLAKGCPIIAGGGSIEVCETINVM